MGLEGIIYIMLGASIFGIGIAVGGVIEYKLVTRSLKDRDEIYHHNIEEIGRSLDCIESRIRVLHTRISSTTDEIRIVKGKIEKYDPEITQMIDMRNQRVSQETPPLPYSIKDTWESSD